MKKGILLIAIACTLFFTVARAQQKHPSELGGPNQRFQIFAAQVEYSDQKSGDFAEHEVFLLDTQTGRVWRYQSNFVVEGPKGEAFVKEKFMSVQTED